MKFLNQNVPKAGKDMPAYYKRALTVSEALLAGFFASLCYSLVLVAMNYVTNVSYVQVFRQLGLPIGMGLGVLILKEHCTWTKVIGVILILSGLAISVIPCP